VLDVEPDAGQIAHRVLDQLAPRGFRRCRVFFGIMRRSIFMTTLPGTTLVLVPSMRPTSMVGESMPGTTGLILFSSGNWP